MDTFITLIGVSLLGLSFTICLVTAFKNKKLNQKNGSLLVCFFVGIFLFGFGIRGTYIGNPKTSIKAGHYAVVRYAEMASKNGQFYHMILRQDGEEVKLYSLSKDMIDIAQSGAKGGTLEVVEKSGLRKAVLYLPIPVN